MKKNKINLFFVLISILLCSCGAPKFYNEINEMQESTKNLTEKNNDEGITINIKSYNINKLVLNKLKRELAKTCHIIYLSSPDASLISRKFWIIVYDVDNEIYYTVENSSIKPKEIEISNSLKDNYYRFIFNSYLENKCEILKQSGRTKISGVRTYEAIYDVNLESKENKNCYFRNFLFFGNVSN